jgi:hypothetical protein
MYNQTVGKIIAGNGTYPGSVSVSVSTRVNRVTLLVEMYCRRIYVAEELFRPALRLSG